MSTRGAAPAAAKQADSKTGGQETTTTAKPAAVNEAGAGVQRTCPWMQPHPLAQQPWVESRSRIRSRAAHPRRCPSLQPLRARPLPPRVQRAAARCAQRRRPHPRGSTCRQAARQKGGVDQQDASPRRSPTHLGVCRKGEQAQVQLRSRGRPVAREVPRRRRGGRSLRDCARVRREEVGGESDRDASLPAAAPGPAAACVVVDEKGRACPARRGQRLQQRRDARERRGGGDPSRAQRSGTTCQLQLQRRHGEGEGAPGNAPPEGRLRRRERRRRAAERPTESRGHCSSSADI